MAQRPLEAVVIGAGMGGLAAAARLVTGGAKVTLLEAGPRPGGKVTSEDWDDYTVDFAPHLFSSSSASEIAEVGRMLGVEPRFIVPDGAVATVLLGDLPRGTVHDRHQDPHLAVVPQGRDQPAV